MALTWNKEHDASSKRAVEPLKGREVGKGEDSCDDASKAWHGREDHEGASGVPVGWGVKQGRESTSKSDEAFIWRVTGADQSTANAIWKLETNVLCFLLHQLTVKNELRHCLLLELVNGSHELVTLSGAAINRSSCTGKSVYSRMESQLGLCVTLMLFTADTVPIFYMCGWATAIQQIQRRESYSDHHPAAKLRYIWCILCSCFFTLSQLLLQRMK